MTSATTDLVTGESMMLVDNCPNGWQRTMTIITKIDGRDENFLANFKLVDKGLGAFCVRNRTQKEISDGLSFAGVLAEEQKVLTLDDFMEIPEEQKGIPKLIEALISHQREMIMNFKPELREKLATQRETS